MIKAIIFDWGGVLAPSERKTGIARLSKNFHFDQEAFDVYFRDHEDDFCHTQGYEPFYAKAEEMFKIPVASIYRALFATLPDEVYDIAKNLSQKYDVYILSNQLKPKADFIRQHFDISFFADVFFSNELGMKKPNEDIFHYVLDKIGFKPEEVVFVDDNPNNIATASSLGIHAIRFVKLNQMKKEFAKLGIE
jgi:putative hydrolase of the HAD superfamily